MRRGNLLTPAALLIGAALSLPATGQRESYSFVSYAGPEVSLLSAASDEEVARINTPVLAGDRLVTGGTSRAEVVLASGNLVRIDVKSELRFDRMSRTYEADDDRDLLVLTRGAVAAEIRAQDSGERAFRLDTDDATVVVEGRGLVRVDAGRRGTEVYVLSGEAEVAGQGGWALIRAGQYAYVLGADEIAIENYDPPRDRFTRFVDERRDRRSEGGAATWVSSDYDYESSLAGFDENGSWVYASTSDRWCWRPNVAPGWRPYTNGYWRWTPCGLTWVSYEPWGWLPYHYGSWSWESAFGWVWMPGSVYAPAWVYWSYSPSYVGWCPIGYYGTGRGRSDRSPRGGDGSHRIPHLRGRVELARVDPRAWNFAPLPRMGSQLDPSRDILHGERLPIRPTDTAVISTSPLRIERGRGPAPAAVREALRKVAEPAGPGGGVPINQGLTAFLRRDGALTPAAERELRRVIVSTRRDEALRPLAPETLASPATEGPRKSRSSAARRDDGRVPDSAGREAVGSVAPRRRDSVPGNGWRSPASPAPRDLVPRPTDVVGQSDTGWQAPRAVDGNRAPVRRSTGGDWREAPPRAPVSRAAPAEAVPRRDTSPRVPAPEVAPRRNAPPVASAPGVAPQRVERPAPRVEAPPRLHEAPRAAPPSAPRITAPAPAPRAPAPPRGDSPKQR